MTSKVQPAEDYWTIDVKSAARCRLLNRWRQKIIELLIEETWGQGCVI